MLDKRVFYVLTGIIAAHLLLTPFTKVEESFTIQAVHDILKYGIYDISNYDHIKFPGAVPRTFIGALIVSSFSWVAMWIGKFDILGDILGSNLSIQILSRFVIGCMNSLSLAILVDATDKVLLKTYDREMEDYKNKEEKAQVKHPRLQKVSTWFIILLGTQFHIMYYSSRPLPNFVISLPLSNIALALAIRERYDIAIWLLSFATVVFRLELGALCAGLAMYGLMEGQTNWVEVIKSGLGGILVGSGLSGAIDSYFWGRWCIPELVSFKFNVVSGKSAVWGTEPPYSYLTKYLPRIFLPATVPIFARKGYSVSPKSIKVVANAILYHLIILSLQPHKEWRFIVYIIPPATILASIGLSDTFSMLNEASIWIRSIFKAVILLLPAVSLLATAFMSYVSSLNYPGGEALQVFNNYAIRNNISDVTVHLDVYTCMTGASLFGQLPDKYNITYDKTEDESLSTLWHKFDYVIATTSEPLPVDGNYTWQLVESPKAFDHVNLRLLFNSFNNEVKHGLPLLKCIYQQRSIRPLLSLIDKAIFKSHKLGIYKRDSAA
ncbi:HHL081Cp [Eremothecium sinecaudum]|uniref:Mannosyltransferase n=1 Tax=Eremothecium sinecaudum TaxID=45286 RepID=A0A0X8HWF5_9SACH|nr:HHL081Cp [Eremothecium sinecaudum]AMD22689.1 HHL081Cp [Eremothecium sinecaudum]